MKTNTQLQADVIEEIRADPQTPAPLTTTGQVLTFHTDAGVNLIPWDYDAQAHAQNDQGLRTLQTLVERNLLVVEHNVAHFP